MKIPDLSVRRPIAAKMIFLLLIILGIYSYMQLPINLLPSINYPRLEIVTEYPNVGPQEVQNLVTEPLISHLNSLENIKNVEGISKKGVSIVHIEYNWGTDMNYSLLFLRQVLDQVAWSLPEKASRPTIIKKDPSQKPIMGFALSSENLSALSDLSKNVFKKRLEEISGVAKVEILGEYKRKIDVNIKPKVLERYNLRYQDIKRAIRLNNMTFRGGAIQRGDKKYSLHISADLEDLSDIKQIHIQRNGPSIRLGKIADIKYSFKENYNKSFFNSQETIGLMVYKEPSKNILKTANRVNKAMKALKDEFGDVQFIEIFNQATFVRASVDNLIQSLLIGALLAFFVLYLFIRKFGKTLVIFINIPISIIVILMVMYFMGLDINVISLAGLALGCGMLVDNSIIVFENIHRKKSSGKLSKNEVAEGANQVARAITASTFTNICVFFPLIYLSGLTGELLSSLALTVTASLLVSLLSALSLLPSLLVTKVPTPSFLKKLSGEEQGFSNLTTHYERLFNYFLSRRKKVLIVVGLIFILSLVSIPFLEKSIFPQTESNLYKVNLKTEENTSFKSTIKTVQALTSRLQNNLSDFVFSNVGIKSGYGEENRSVNSAQLTIKCKPGTRVAKRIRSLVAPERMGIEELVVNKKKNVLQKLGEGINYDFLIKVSGNEWSEVSSTARKISTALEGRGYPIEQRNSLSKNSMGYKLELRRKMMKKYNIDQQSLINFMKTRLKGINISSLNLVNENIKIFLTANQGKEILREEFLNTPYPQSSSLIPLSALVKLVERESVAKITSVNNEPTITLPINLEGETANRLRENWSQILSTAGVPREVEATLTGSWSKTKDYLTPLIGVFLLSLILIYTVLSIQYESLYLPVIILISVPFAVTGAIILLHITHSSLNVIALVGMIVLIGIAVNDAILKVDFYEKWRQEGANMTEAVREVGKVRLRPILMTSFSTIFALSPILLSIGGHTDLWRPLAVVIIGGLLSSTFLTLFILPLIYVTLDHFRG